MVHQTCYYDTCYLAGNTPTPATTLHCQLDVRDNYQKLPTTNSHPEQSVKLPFTCYPTGFGICLDPSKTTHSLILSPTGTRLLTHCAAISAIPDSHMSQPQHMPHATTSQLLLHLRQGPGCSPRISAGSGRTGAHAGPATAPARAPRLRPARQPGHVPLPAGLHACHRAMRAPPLRCARPGASTRRAPPPQPPPAPPCWR
mmetsp:Transcript_19335/g.49194  ORF Transcript_19335/g.49194 Transcript_19335/m.49194 type:complete len:200 (-) Transcript_19335:1403-2002(-)